MLQVFATLVLLYNFYGVRSSVHLRFFIIISCISRYIILLLNSRTSPNPNICFARGQFPILIRRALLILLSIRCSVSMLASRWWHAREILSTQILLLYRSFIICRLAEIHILKLTKMILDQAPIFLLELVCHVGILIWVASWVVELVVSVGLATSLITVNAEVGRSVLIVANPLPLAWSRWIYFILALRVFDVEGPLSSARHIYTVK